MVAHLPVWLYNLWMVVPDAYSVLLYKFASRVVYLYTSRCVIIIGKEKTFLEFYQLMSTLWIIVCHIGIKYLNIMLMQFFPKLVLVVCCGLVWFKSLPVTTWKKFRLCFKLKIQTVLKQACVMLLVNKSLCC